MIILATIAIKMQKSLRTDTTWMIFSNMVVSLVAACALDLCWELAALRVVWMPPISYFSVVFLFYFVANFTAYLWFIFSETMQESPLVTTRKKRLLLALPLLALTLLMLASLKTHWIYYITPASAFEHGTYFFIEVALLFGYSGVTSINAFLRAAKKGNYVNRGKYLSL